jgi:hypothetical protein
MLTGNVAEIEKLYLVPASEEKGDTVPTELRLGNGQRIAVDRHHKVTGRPTSENHLNY